MAKQPVIVVKDLVNRFGKQVVHDHLSFELAGNQIVGLVGGSGSGKSVLLRTLIGLNTPQHGTVEVMGKTITALNEDEMFEAQRLWGVMFQNGALFSSLTVLENIMVPLVEHTDMPDDLAAELARTKLALVGLPCEAGHKYPSQLSGGMKKRAALARALALDPAILFLDEPTAGLDPIAAAEFDELIRSLQEGLGLTVVIITHDLDTLFSICHRIAVLVDKRIVVDTLEGMTQSEHPWIRSYFHGPRARAVPRAEQGKK